MIKYLGVDWGEKRIGLALANSENRISTPFKTVFSPSALLELVEEEGINFLVIGNPRKMSGQESDNKNFLRFINFIEKELSGKGIQIALIDERLSSLQADSIMNKKMNSNRDSLAAMIILQSYLDKR
jgi:putative Holliday junction resolvase